MTEQMSKHDHVLMGLVMNLQTMAMAQLGKIPGPATGEIERDLDGARGTIDLLEMLKAKCRTDTPASLLQMLDKTVMDLQMNYVDEKKRDAQARASDEHPGEQAESEAAAAEAAAMEDSGGDPDAALDAEMSGDQDRDA